MQSRKIHRADMGSDTTARGNDDVFLIYSLSWTLEENEERAKRLYAEEKISIAKLVRWLGIIWEKHPQARHDE